ncbi:MAG: winged helix-turn-helix domain-containing protein [Promethearchaeota archaeon]
MDPNLLNYLDNESKIIYLLKELGDLPFKNIMDLTHLSRNTVNKYLKKLLDSGYISKNLKINPQGRDLFIYHLEFKGLKKYSPRFLLERDKYWIIALKTEINELNRQFSKGNINEEVYRKKLTELNMIESKFYDLVNIIQDLIKRDQYLGEPRKVLTQIANFALKFGKNFFKEERSLFDYLAVFYIYLNSIDYRVGFASKNIFINRYMLNQDFLERITDFENILKILNFSEQKYYKIMSKLHTNEYSDFFEELKILARYFFNQLNIENLYRYTIENMRDISHIINKLSLLEQSESMDTKIFKKSIEKTIEIKLKKLIIKNKDLIQKLSISMKNLISSIIIELIMYDYCWQELGKSIEKISSNPINYGITYFSVGNEEFFFHRNDYVGTMLDLMINDSLNRSMIERDIFGAEYITRLSDIAEEITKHMAILNIIQADENFLYKFKNIVLNRLFNRAVEIGLTQVVSIELYEELFNTDGIDLYRKIFTDPSIDKSLQSEMDWINQLYYTVKGRHFMFKEEDITENLIGFCNYCGNPIINERNFEGGDSSNKTNQLIKTGHNTYNNSARFESNGMLDLNLNSSPDSRQASKKFLNKCEFCGNLIDLNNLETDFKKAKRKRKEFKSKLYLDLNNNTFEFIECENCGSLVGRTWERCPVCKRKIKK